MNDDGEVEALRSLVTGQTAVDHPEAFRRHASSKKNRPSGCLFPFRMATVLPLRTAWIADILSQSSLRDVERQRCWKRGSAGRRAETFGLLYGTTERSFNAVDKRRFDAHLNRLQGHRRQPIARSGKLNLYDVLIRGERWIVLMVSPIVRNVQRQRCWKRGSGDGQGLSLYDYSTTERSFNAVER